MNLSPRRQALLPLEGLALVRALSEPGAAAAAGA